MNKHIAALAIVEAALPAIAFEGWRMEVLEQAAPIAGFSAADCVRFFPGGVSDALELFARAADARMVAAYGAQTPPARVHERIARLVRLRIEAYAPHTEAVRKALAFSSLPHHAPRALASLSRTMDMIWYTAGDVSVDFNWYTKRLTLAGVYSATLLFWVNDESEGHAETWQFLQRRLQEVGAFGKFKKRVAGFFGVKAAG